MPSRDYYDVLSVSKQASAEEIKQAYRKQALKYHPDRNDGDKSAEEKFKEASEAYQVLGDPQKRAQYDQFGHEAFQATSRGGGAGFQDINDIFSSSFFSDIFDQMGFGMNSGFSSSPFGSFSDEFSNARRSRFDNRRSKGADLRYRLNVTLEDVIKGTEKKVEFSAELNCKECKGTGAKNGDALKTCHTCGGKGQTMQRQSFISFASTCSTCSGRGEVVEFPCGPCHGTGQSKQNRALMVTVPQGVEPGTKLRIQGEGEAGYKHGVDGDLFVEISVEDHADYEVEGRHLIRYLDVSYLEAILGCQLEPMHFGDKIKVSIPKGSQPGDTIEIKNKGLPYLGGGSRRGSLFYKLKLNIPKKINKKQLELLKELVKVSV